MPRKLHLTDKVKAADVSTQDVNGGPAEVAKVYRMGRRVGRAYVEPSGASASLEGEPPTATGGSWGDMSWTKQ